MALLTLDANTTRDTEWASTSWTVRAFGNFNGLPSVDVRYLCCLVWMYTYRRRIRVAQRRRRVNACDFKRCNGLAQANPHGICNLMCNLFYVCTKMQWYCHKFSLNKCLLHDKLNKVASKCKSNLSGFKVKQCNGKIACSLLKCWVYAQTESELWSCVVLLPHCCCLYTIWRTTSHSGKRHYQTTTTT